MQMPFPKSGKPIEIIPKNKAQNTSKTVANPDYREAILLFGLVAKCGKVGLGSVSPADVLQALRSNRLQVTKAAGFDIVVVESAENRGKISVRLPPGVIDTLLKESKRNPGGLSPRCHHACLYLNGESVKTKLFALGRKRGATITLSGNTIAFA